MPRTRLIIKQSNAQRKSKSPEAQIFVSYAHGSKTSLFYTRQNIFIKYWDKKNQSVKRAWPSNYKLNMYLSKFRQKIEDILHSAMFEDTEPTTTYVKSVYNGRKLKKQQLKSITFWKFVDEYLENGKVRLSSSTVKSYKTAVSNLKAYEKYSRIKLEFDNIDLKFYHDYMDYYIGYRELKISGFGKVIKFLKTVLNSGTDQGYNSNTIFKSNGFRVVNKSADNIYLNENELKRIINLDLSENKKLVRVRDLFYLGCYTGLRFSDYHQINSENIVNNYLHVKTQKTGKDVVIPLMDEVLPLIEKYNRKLQKPMTNQVMNRYLKKIGELAGIDDAFDKYHTSGKGRIKETFKKWEQIVTLLLDVVLLQICIREV